MIDRTSAVFALALTACFCLAPAAAVGQAPAPSQPTTQAQSSAGVIPVELEKTLDSKKLKAGDEVATKTLMDLHTGNGTTIPKGSKVIGHVAQSTARNKGDADSSLGITFEKIEMKNGQAIPLKATVQAIGPPPGAASTLAAPDTGLGLGGGSAGSNNSATRTNSTGGTATTPSPINGNAPPPDATQPEGNTAPSSNSGHLTGRSVGVVGIPGLQLGQDSVFTSKGKSVKLDSGSQLILRVQSQ